MFTFVQHFQFMCLHLFKLVYKLNFALEGILVCIVQLFEFMRIVKLYLLNVYLLQYHVINDKFISYLIRFKSLCWVIWFLDTFFLTFQKSTMTIANRSSIAQMLEFQYIVFGFLISEVMMYQFNLVLNFNAFFNVSFDW